MTAKTRRPAKPAEPTRAAGLKEWLRANYAKGRRLVVADAAAAFGCLEKQVRNALDQVRRDGGAVESLGDGAFKVRFPR
ncbi:hypothetical protein GXW77_13250 [Roseomonas alkaliterrae]|uniref:hypothetical protein n=1 Tax=Neoroseomonas alkaliterrae TaxID=1452450 RepID=UPI001BA47933|nr:hypothetical protein [Neoroseomonas alkaliterrae]MBR0677144.1 hypothetical protein [Neoroseomonas alkaliterrae]